MKEKIEEIYTALEKLTVSNAEELEQARIHFLGSKGVVKGLFKDFKSVPNEEKKAYGQLLNEVKNKAEARIEELKSAVEEASTEGKYAHLDLTRPSGGVKMGSQHPIELVKREITEIFTAIGFDISEGPEIEDDWHNFSALNFPDDHPARDMQDTFFVEGAGDFALRTHTSSVQVRMMENNQPPIRTISPGRVFRNEAISARAHCFFHQVEALYIDKEVSFADLKQTLLYFAKTLFGDQTEIRLRPSYFPFTEPSAEMDISCTICEGKGCNVCKYTGWLEILGCGMVDPNVLKNCDIDPEVYSGYALGMGIERIAQLKYRVNDLRLYSENDVRFLHQFKSQ